MRSFPLCFLTQTLCFMWACTLESLMNSQQTFLEVEACKIIIRAVMLYHDASTRHCNVMDIAVTAWYKFHLMYIAGQAFVLRIFQRLTLSVQETHLWNRELRVFDMDVFSNEWKATMWWSNSNPQYTRVGPHWIFRFTLKYSNENQKDTDISGKTEVLQLCKHISVWERQGFNLK